MQIHCTPIYLTQGLENDVTARLRSIRLSHDSRRHVSKVSQQTNAVSSQPSHVTDTSATNAVRQARSQLLIMGRGSFSSDFGPFSVWKLEFPVAV